ncbi:MAG: DNA translocase FtsK [Paenibacillaceae bacterium]|nr:DNA translocase FtsK [Paenibacillaceae bacterium]
MARNRKKKKRKSFAGALKYELYGIIILTLSVIALSQEGTVPKAIQNLFTFLIGDKLFWVVPPIFIYIGLYAMIKRGWPREWSVRKSGLLLLLIGLMIYFEQAMIHKKDPFGLYGSNATFIISQTFETLRTMFKSGLTDGPIDYGGGMAGAILYAVLYFLFGNTGAKIIVYTLFVLSFLLITGVSFVEWGGRVRGSTDGLRKGFGNRVREWLAGSGNRRAPSRAAAAKSVPAAIPAPQLYDDDEEDVIDVSPKPRKKKPMFFQLLNPPKRQEQPEASPSTGAAPMPPSPSFGVDDDEAEEDSAALPAWNEAPVVKLKPRQAEAEDDALAYLRKAREEEAKALLAKPAAVAPEPVAAGPLVQAEMELDIGDGEAKPFDMAAVDPDAASHYSLPSLNLLGKPAGGNAGDLADQHANGRKLEATLESFGVRARVLDVVRGPAVTRYEIQPDVGVKVSRIVSLTDDIALALAAKDIRMEAPIPGKSAIGIEVPNTEVSMVTLREVMETGAFQDAGAKLTIAFGRDISGQPIVGNLARMPHLLVAGATGSGKSVCINGIITSVLYKARPNEVKFLMIDPKMVELNVYNGIPHLLAPVVTDPRRASLALKKIVVEMEKRYELFSKSGTRNIEGYNALITDKNNPNPGEPLPLIVVIVDELADLMMVAAGDVEDSICRLAQMARAAGIHLIIATQRPSVDVITGVIKANIPSRIAFGVSSQVDSRTILDMVGAEKLLGRGDMLFLPVGASKPVRVQGAFLSDQEVEKVVTFVRDQEQANYREELVPMVEEAAEQAETFEDELFEQAVQIVLEAKQASVSLLQRRMRVGYTRAARLIDSMEAKGVVGPYEGSKPREVLMTIEQFFQNRISS